MRLKNISRVSLIALATLLTACGEKAPPAAAPSTPSTSPTPSATLASSAPLKLVRTLVVDTTAQEESNRYSGEVRARHETQLGFRTGGKIIERLVDAGARVKAGQALARLDPADAQLASAHAEANRALAAAELKRSQDLRAKNFISQAALDAK